MRLPAVPVEFVPDAMAVSAIELVAKYEDLVDVCFYVDGVYSTSLYRGDVGFEQFEDWWRHAPAELFDEIDPTDANGGVEPPEDSHWWLRFDQAGVEG